MGKRGPSFGFLKLGQKDIAELKEFASEMSRHGKLSARKRATAVALSYEEHWSVKQIAKFLGRCERTIYDWFRRFRKNGIAGLYHHRPSPPPKLTPAQIDQMMQVSGWAYRAKAADRRRWPLRQIAGWIKKQWGISISYETVRQIIRRRLFPSRYLYRK